MKKLLLFLLCACCSIGSYAVEYYVDGSVGVTGAGTSWTSPYKTIAEAVAAATGNGSIVVQDTICIKQGTYAERINLTVTNTDKISIKGSYASASTGTDRTQRSLVSSPTILDGTTLGAGSPGLSISKASGTADRLIIQNFLATGTSQGTPGGLSLAISTATVSNCIIRNNTHTSTATKGSAGGVYMTGGTLQDCEVYGNVLSGTGSGINLLGGGIQTIGGTINRCRIYNNTTNGHGGGVFVGKVTTSYATHDYIVLSANVLISNTLIYNNGKEGLFIGKLSTDTKVVTLTNNTIVNNEGSNIFIDNLGAAISPSYLIATNNIFSFNGGVETFSELTSFTYNAINVAVVTQSGNIALANSNSAVGFVSPSTVNGYSTPINASVTSANWNLGSGSVCKSLGTGSGSGTSDVAGNPRVVGTIDMGAYETTGYFQSKASGNWATPATWQTSEDNATWADATLAPTSSAPAINVLLGHEVTVASAATASTLTVNAGGKLTLNSGVTLSATNLNLKSTVTDGTATFKDLDGTLSVSGTTNVEQYLTTGRNWYVSSPVSAATSNVFAADATNPILYYVETVPNTFPTITNTTTGLDAKKGYVANISSDRVVTFTGGSLNTGAQSITGLTSGGATFTGFNLVGNPYPSYYDWDNATKTNVGTSIWYRSKSTGSWLFQTYNSAGGASVNGGTNLIPPMQAFWVKVAAGQTGTIDLVNAYRSHQDQSVATNRLKAPAQLDARKQVRLQVSNAVNTDEALIYANANAQDGFDMYDSDKMFGNSASVPEIYTVLGNEKLAINGVKDFAENQQMALGFKTTVANTFSIKASEVKNFAADTKIILIDHLLTNQEFDLTDGAAYSFTSDVANNVSRFSLIFRAPGGTTGLTKAEKMNAQVFVNTANQISILAPASCNYAVYNLVGQKVANGRTTATQTTATHQLQSGIYVVKVTENGRNFTSKVLVN